MRACLILFLLLRFISAWDALPYLKSKGFTAEYLLTSGHFVFQKEGIRLTIEPLNTLFSINQYVLSFGNYPADENGELRLGKQDSVFFTNTIEKVLKKTAAAKAEKKEAELESELAFLRENLPEEQAGGGGKIDLIFIDPGHGGKDPGAQAYGYNEKDLTLRISQSLKKAVEFRLPGPEVILTRDKDEYLTLDKRCSLANNRLKKDLNGIFVSIHLNIWFDPATTGFEVYYLAHGTNSMNARIVALENGVFDSEKTNVEALELYERIFNRISVVQYQRESRKLADCITFSTYDRIKDYPVNRGVKSDLFYVLKGALMPGVLIEGGFISNPRDLEFITDDTKLSNLTSAIAEGIAGYAEEFEATKGWRYSLPKEEP